ncbi:glycosyl transferase group 1 [Thermaerobacter marianensis DSM 12885]|uniref:Glycosyl transferase group 1 n=1 Tax=Thermaerobacter marianensis (strain ATCC 700841 / DSM 12885 / JCM 10246 / 7p75a) TaxID=644966 RepID=E6SHR6_THEM7|nr:glycosyltransferase family 4 protein [Thermaerobacter marianensis]ADU50763.1 glycosyl transferase group 1 [Thermaerobacter marianensis DSM 12885]
MRILLVTGNLFPHAGGLSTHMDLLRKGLEALGHEVRIRSFADFTPGAKLLTRGPSWALNRVRRGWGAVWTAALRVHFLSRILRVEAGWVDGLNVEDPMAAAAARRAGLPYVYTAHGYPTDEHVAAGRIRPGTGAHRWLLELERAGLRHARHVVAVDSRIAGHVRRLAGHDRVTVIPNFIDAEWPQRAPSPTEARAALGIPPDAFVILCPRRLTAKNGVLYAVQALERLVAEGFGGGDTAHHQDADPAAERPGPGFAAGPAAGGPAATGETVRPLLVIVGSGEQEALVRRFVRERGLEAHCRLEGERPHADMGYYLRAADAVVVPSVHEAGVEEATSISALEAMAFRVPLVASAVGGLREIVRAGETGILVPQRDPEALARALWTVARDRQRAARMVEAAYRYVLQHHSHLAAARRFLQIYRHHFGAGPGKVAGTP